MKWMNLTIDILDFGVRLYGGSELSKHLSKCLPWMRKTQKIKPIRIFLWQMNILEAVCKCDCLNVRLYLLFNVRTFQTKILDSVCNDLFKVNNNDNLVCKDAYKWTNLSFQCCRITWQKNKHLERLERWTNQFSFQLILHRFSLWGCHVMNELNEITWKKDLFILLNETQRSESVKWSELFITTKYFARISSRSRERDTSHATISRHIPNRLHYFYLYLPQNVILLQKLSFVFLCLTTDELQVS